METKKSILSVMALLCSTIVFGQSINESFHTIMAHYRPIVINTKDKGQENALDSVAMKDSMTADSAHVMNTDYSSLSIEQLEKLIILYENYLHKKRESSTLIEHNNQQVISYYTGESHELTLANLIDVIEEVGLSNQLFVLAQAVLETGHFTSPVCKNYHNLFGLYDSKHKDYYRFARWEDSVVGYQKFIQYRYKGGNYLQFLKRIGYAEDPRYTTTVAKIATQLYKRLFTQ
ncbi:MAG: glucosaminidase domain-containing protein [Prevotella sp.]|jgi:uncharacterized FlgJ-related protein|nr:glucosaminidase domain-containing protein [Prevotella sp.]